MRTAANIAIILLAAAAIAFLPSGSEVAAVAGRALSLAFILVFGLGLAWAYRRFGFDFERLPPAFRVLAMGAVGVLVLVFAGWGRLSAGPGGVLVAIALIAGCVGAGLVVYQRYRTLI